MIVLVCGGRTYDDNIKLSAILDAYGPQISLLIHGGARGADKLAGEWAERHGVPVRVFPANWDQQHSSAGPIRNQQMLDQGKPDMVIAFPGDRGTADMVKRAKIARIKVREVDP